MKEKLIKSLLAVVCVILLGEQAVFVMQSPRTIGSPMLSEEKIVSLDMASDMRADGWCLAYSEIKSKNSVGLTEYQKEVFCTLISESEKLAIESKLPKNNPFIFKKEGTDWKVYVENKINTASFYGDINLFNKGFVGASNGYYIAKSYVTPSFKYMVRPSEDSAGNLPSDYTYNIGITSDVLDNDFFNNYFKEDMSPILSSHPSFVNIGAVPFIFLGF